MPPAGYYGCLSRITRNGPHEKKNNGGGFGGDNQLGRVCMGVARVTGPASDYRVQKLWGGHQALAPADFGGRWYGILALDGRLFGVYDAPSPWGPWSTVTFSNAWELGLQTGTKTVFWNFSSKWYSADGRRFVLVFTGPGGDEWGTVLGRFVLARDPG